MPFLETKRLFLALELPGDIRALLENHQKDLKAAGADVKWVEPAHIHLTLKFLGDIPADRIPGIAGALNENFGKEKRLDVALDRLGGFPSLHQPRVLWAGLWDEKNALGQMAQVLDNALLKLGFPRETREFQAHVTLGRVRSPLNRLALVDRINRINAGFIRTVFPIDNITLIASRLSPLGPAYTILHQITFPQ